MQLFWYLILGLALCITYLISLRRPTPILAGVYIVSLLGIGGSLFASGLEVPGKGIDTSVANTITYTFLTYTTTNSLLVAGAAWLFTIYGLYLMWLFLKKAMTGGISRDGTIQ